jgi:hypothetical protein
MKFKIIEVPRKVMRDYDGMNYMAARALNFRGYPIRQNTILIDSSMSAKRKKRTIAHEKAEYSLMKKGLGYWSAHLYALKHERCK